MNRDHYRRPAAEAARDEEHTNAAIQDYLDELASDSPSESVIRALLDQVVDRLHMLCATLLHRGYPRLMRPPLNLQADELLGAVVARLLKALRQVQPATPRQFFALASQHIRWELNDIARHFDRQPVAQELQVELVPSPVNTDADFSPKGHRILAAIERLPEGEREAFDLVRMQEMSQTEAAEILGVSVMTVNRRLNRSVQLLSAALRDLNARHQELAIS